jgi:ATP-dependent DNA helicase
MSPRYLLSAPLTAQQKELYDAVVNKTVRSFLIDRKTAREDGGSSVGSTAPSTPLPSAPSSDAEMTDAGSISGRTRRKKGRGKRNYEEKSDEQFFDDLDADEGTTAPGTEDDGEDNISMSEMGRAHRQRQARVLPRLRSFCAIR